MRAHFGALAAKAPRHELPSWLLHCMAPFAPAVRVLLPQLGKTFAASSQKAQRLLGWNARPNEESIIDTVHSFTRFGLLNAARA
jgi:dihydroflavonol-4-reductase